MNGPAPPAVVDPSFRRTEALGGLRKLQAATVIGLFGQLLIWGSALALWIVGSLFSNIPVSVRIAYGAGGISVSAAAVFALNVALIVGAAVALVSFALTARSFQLFMKATPALNFDVVISLVWIGIVGSGMFAFGWALWLGSFVPPGTGPNLDLTAYAPVLSSNISVVVDLLLVFGGLLTFVGLLGTAWGNSRLGTTFDESSIEVGGVLSLLPVFSVTGYTLATIGIARCGRKVERGWIPAPPAPPPPIYPPGFYDPRYGGIQSIAVPPRPSSWDSLVVVLVVVLVLFWVIILPIALIATSGLTHGAANSPTPLGAGGNSTAPTSDSSSSAVPIVLVGLAVTAVLLPLAVYRNRIKRQRPATPTAAPPQPPPQPPPPPKDEDPLDHMV